ncbi:Protein AF-9 ALL1-fused gene from chromosome 9 protein [Takifugu flavidus]|uniref:Protein AF-9 ALL1-fused gene from chromosome 9 protein n=1 Tax=Takifugu flavidus TaxID=433684 RepID=A0A5C6NCS9_9TELE|nr:Protein AF-9 ALL1-fused gene from chromosome 9 protein [Takifugu flavidus]
MANLGAVQVKLELGHRAQVRKKPTVEGFTHDWMVFVRGPEHSNIQHFVDKVVFHLHESFPKPKRVNGPALSRCHGEGLMTVPSEQMEPVSLCLHHRAGRHGIPSGRRTSGCAIMEKLLYPGNPLWAAVCKDPPYKIEESGYAGFILPIEVYFKNKEEPKKVRFDYDLFLHLEGHPPVNHLRCEKLTFNNPTEEFRRKLLKAGGQQDPHKRPTDDLKMMVLQEGSTHLHSQHLKLPTLPNSSLTSTFPDPKKSKTPHGSKDHSKGSGGAFLTTTSATSTSSASFSKLHKPSKDQKQKPLKDLKEPKSAFRDSLWDPSKPSKEPSGRPKENQPLKDINSKIGFKESKTLSKEHQAEDINPNSGPNKYLPKPDCDDHRTKKRKKGFADVSGKATSDFDTQHLGKKVFRDRLQMQTGQSRLECKDAECRKVPNLPPFQELVDPNDSDMEDQSTKSDLTPLVEILVNSKPDGRGEGFMFLRYPSLNSTVQPVPLPVQAVVQHSKKDKVVLQEHHSDVNDDDSEDEQDHDMESDAERPAPRHLTHHSHRVTVSLSDGCDSDSSSPSPPSHNKAPASLRSAHNQILEIRSSAKQNKQDKNRNLDCDKAYLEELVELHKRLMTLREGHVLQQIVNLIEETGHFHITNTTFDFDLCSLDRGTVRKLQSYLETSGLS